MKNYKNIASVIGIILVIGTLVGDSVFVPFNGAEAIGYNFIHLVFIVWGIWGVYYLFTGNQKNIEKK